MSKKNKEIKTNAIRIVESNKIQYTLHLYDAPEGFLDGVSVAKQTGMDVNMVFKTLVLQGNSHEYYVCVIPVAEELDLKKVAKHFHEKNVGMIHAKMITEITGYIKGGCSPIGMKKQFKTVIHPSGRSMETIFVSGGKVGLQLGVNPIELAELINADFADLIK